MKPKSRLGRPALLRPGVGTVIAFYQALALAGAGAGEPAKALEFRIVPSRSMIRFDARATGHTVHGVTRQVEGEVVFDPEDLSRRAEVRLRIQAAGLETGNKIRDRKMRESHLETQRHPLIAFRSIAVQTIAPTLRAGETQEMTVRGILTLHGVDRRVSFPVKAARHGADVVVTGETVLRLTDYAIPIPTFLFVKLQDEVKVMFEVVAATAATEP